MTRPPVIHRWKIHILVFHDRQFLDRENALRFQELENRNFRVNKIPQMPLIKDEWNFVV